MSEELPKNTPLPPPAAAPSRRSIALPTGFFSLLLLVLAIALGVWLGYKLFAPKAQAIESATVLLEKIQAVAKLTTVEGQFTEIYSYNDYQGSFGMLWDKKVLVRVRAKVSAGYDLQALNVQTDAVNHVIRINALPEPQILSIDHSLDYYDVTEGLFASFSPQDYTRIGEQSKNLIREQAQKSNLMSSAREQGQKILDMMKLMVEGAGWKMEIVGQGGGLPQ